LSSVSCSEAIAASFRRKASHRDEIEGAHDNIEQHAEALLNHKNEIQGARYDLKEHKKVFENHKLNIEKLRSKVNSNIVLQHEVFLDHKGLLLRPV
jgi:Fic family protein